jgi:hypothetical protein
MYGFSQQVTAFVVPPPLRQEAPRNNAAGRDIMKAKFVFIPDCRRGPTRVIALHQYLAGHANCGLLGNAAPS